MRPRIAVSVSFVALMFSFSNPARAAAAGAPAALNAGPAMIAGASAFGAAGVREADRRGDSFYVSGTVSTLGAGLEISRSLAGRFALRVAARGFEYGFDNTDSGIDYALDLRLRSLGAHLDWHPGGGGAFLSGGILYNGNEVGALGEPADATVEIGDMVFDSAAVGVLTGTVTFEEFAPVAGAGWNTAFAGSRVGLHLFAGVVFQGTPALALSADGELAGEPLFQQELERERAELQEDLNAFRFYPVASLGLTLRF